MLCLPEEACKAELLVANKRIKRKIPSPFTEDEDRKLMILVQRDAAIRNPNKSFNDNVSIDVSNINWKNISIEMETRSVRQCKERYMHYLSPTIKKNEWAFEEDSLLISLINEHGKKWKSFESFLIGRTEIDIHNRYNILSRKFAKISRMKLDRQKKSKSNSTTEVDTQEDIPPMIIPDTDHEINNQERNNQYSVNETDIGRYFDIPPNTYAILYEMEVDSRPANQLVTNYPNAVYYESYYNFFVS